MPDRVLGVVLVHDAAVVTTSIMVMMRFAGPVSGLMPLLRVVIS